MVANKNNYIHPPNFSYFVNPLQLGCYHFSPGVFLVDLTGAPAYRDIQKYRIRKIRNAAFTYFGRSWFHHGSIRIAHWIPAVLYFSITGGEKTQGCCTHNCYYVVGNHHIAIQDVKDHVSIIAYLMFLFFLFPSYIYLCSTHAEQCSKSLYHFMKIYRLFIIFFGFPILGLSSSPRYEG